MSDYKYILEPYAGRNSRYKCPCCGKEKDFTRYIDTETGEILGENVGKCNHIGNCGYHYTPKQYFEENGSRSEYVAPRPKPKPKPKTASYIDKKVFKKTLLNDNNNLVKYLLSLFTTEIVNQLVENYNIGTSSRWNGGTTVFWQVDSSGNVRSGKLIKYNPTTGKRIKLKEGSLTNWVHSVLGLPDFNLKQCFFGEHLLNKYSKRVVGIVESEKTAVIASIYLPELVWLASGTATGINKEKVKALRGREVILFPDASETGAIFSSWQGKAKEFGFVCSDYIEKTATKEQKVKGIDIADLLGEVNYTNAKINPSPAPPPPPPQAPGFDYNTVYAKFKESPPRSRIDWEELQMANTEWFRIMYNSPN